MLNDIKRLLDLAADDTDRDELLKQLITMATKRLKLLLGGIDPPDDLDYIITDVVCARFNRIGSEGLKSHSVEGESLSFTESDFAEFDNDIQIFLSSQKENAVGKVTFI